MMGVVIDTNILVSALISPKGNPAKIIEMIITGKLKIFYSDEILGEYEEVLLRPKFNLNRDSLRRWLESVLGKGHNVNPISSTFGMLDESDRIFYDVAKSCGIYLVTGNIKHYPSESLILTPTQFLALFEG